MRVTSPTAPGQKSLWIALALISSYMLVEIVGGLAANSLALLADAGHMATDAMALGLALLALGLASRPPSAKRTFGFYRAEVLAALFNALSLWLIAAWVFWEAYRRFLQPPDVQGTLMLSVGFAGLLVNLVAAWVLKRSARENLNVEAALLHVLSDLLGSIAVVAGGILIITLGWFFVDPLFGAIIGLLILLSAGRLLWKVTHVLMEGTPRDLELDNLCRSFDGVAGVTGVHDIHVWSLTSGYTVFSAHVTADMMVVDNRERLLGRLREIASKEFHIPHVTIQLEQSAEACKELHHDSHASRRKQDKATR